MISPNGTKLPEGTRVKFYEHGPTYRPNDYEHDEFNLTALFVACTFAGLTIAIPVVIVMSICKALGIL